MPCSGNTAERIPFAHPHYPVRPGSPCGYYSLSHSLLSVQAVWPEFHTCSDRAGCPAPFRSHPPFRLLRKIQPCGHSVSSPFPSFRSSLSDPISTPVPTAPDARRRSAPIPRSACSGKYNPADTTPRPIPFFPFKLFWPDFHTCSDRAGCPAPFRSHPPFHLFREVLPCGHPHRIAPSPSSHFACSARSGRMAQAAHRPLPAAVKRSGDTVHPVSPPPLGRPAASLLPPHPDEMLVEKRNRFDTAVKVLQPVAFVGRMNRIAVESEAHQDGLDAENGF